MELDEFKKKLAENNAKLLETANMMLNEMVEKYEYKVVEFRQATPEEVKLDLDTPIYYLKLEHKGRFLKYAGNLGDVFGMIRIGYEQIKTAEALKNILENIRDNVGDDIKTLIPGACVIKMENCKKCSAPDCSKRKELFDLNAEGPISSKENPLCN